MPRKPQILTADFPYHVTARSNNKEWFYLPQPHVWKVMTDNLKKVSDAYSAQVLAFVLMSNHFHMLIQTPLANLDKIMNYFMREVSRTIGREAGRINHVFGGRHKPSLIRDPRHFAHAYKYVYRNPVRAGLADRVRTYPFTTLETALFGKASPFPVYDLPSSLAERIPKPAGARLEWLDAPLPKEKEALVQRALRRVTFDFTRERNARHLVAELMT